MERSRSILNKHLWAIAVALLVGSLFSIRWAYPLISEWRSDTPASYVPIRYGSHGYADDYFYYTLARNLFTGHGFATDPISWEHRDRVTPHVSYTASLWLAAAGGMLSHDTRDAYAFNFFVYPSLTFFLIYLLLQSLTQIRWLSVFLAFMSLFAFSEVIRTPNILITNVFLSILVYLFFRYIEAGKRDWTVWLLPLCIGILPGTSVENAIIGWAWSVVLAAGYFKTIPKRTLTALALSSLVVALPFLLKLAEAWPARWIISEYGNFYLESVSGFVLREFAADGARLAIPVLWMSLFRFPYRKFLLCINGSLLAMYIVASPLAGTFAARHVVFRGAELIAYTSQCASLILILKELWSERGLTFSAILGDRRPRRISPKFQKTFTSRSTGLRLIGLLTGLLMAFFAYQRFSEQIASAKSLRANGSDRAFREIVDWTSTHSSPSDVYVTLDSDLLINLFVYSQARVYIPQAMLSSTGSDERAARLFEVLDFYGVDPSALPSLFPGKPTFSGPTDPDLQRHLFALAMYYLKYEPVENLSAHPVTLELQARYALSRNSRQCFHYRATHLVISNFDRRLLGAKSRALSILAVERPIFENTRYAIFPLQHSGLSCSSDGEK